VNALKNIMQSELSPKPRWASDPQLDWEREKKRKTEKNKGKEKIQHLDITPKQKSWPHSCLICPWH